MPQVIGTQILELGTFGHILVTADLILGWSVIILRNLGSRIRFVIDGLEILILNNS